MSWWRRLLALVGPPPPSVPPIDVPPAHERPRDHWLAEAWQRRLESRAADLRRDVDELEIDLALFDQVRQNAAAERRAARNTPQA